MLIQGKKKKEMMISLVMNFVLNYRKYSKSLILPDIMKATRAFFWVDFCVLGRVSLYDLGCPQTHQVCSKVTMNLKSSCLGFLGAEITDVRHHTQLSRDTLANTETQNNSQREGSSAKKPQIRWRKI